MLDYEYINVLAEILLDETCSEKERKLRFELVKKIADKLGVSVDYLFGTEGNRDYTFEERELIMNYRQMTDENKKLFKQLSAELAKHI